MGRAPCCDKANVKKGPWSPEEDEKLKDYIQTHGTGGNWIALPQKAGLKRCGKSCRLRWLNYLRPNIKHGEFSDDEDKLICALFASIGSRWSIMAAQLPGRTDNDIKNYWNTKLKKKMMMMNNLISIPEVTKPLHHLQSFNYSTNNIFTSLSNVHDSNITNNSPIMYNTHTSRYQDQTLSIPSSPSTTAAVVYDHHNNPHHHPVLQSQDHGYLGLGPMESFRVKDNSTLVMFGGDQPSTSSNSDGSTTVCVSDHNNMRNLKSDSYQEFGENFDKVKGYYGDCSLDSSLEEIKQLISTNICSNKIDNNLNFFIDETKEVDKAMYYY